MHIVEVVYSIILYGKVLVWHVCGMVNGGVCVYTFMCVCVCSGQSGEAQRAVFVWFQPPSCSREGTSN